MCFYMGTLGKMVTVGGFDDVVDPCICASVSVEQVLSGKHYNHGLCVHQFLLDALQHQHFKNFRQALHLMSDLCDHAVKIRSDLAKSLGNADCRMPKMMLSIHSLSNTGCTENLLDVDAGCLTWTVCEIYFGFRKTTLLCMFSASALFFDVQLGSPEVCSTSAFLLQSTATSLTHSSWC